MSWPVGMLPGGGPWRILATCPAPVHNTQRASKATPPDRCVCPHALDLRARGNRSRSQRAAGQPDATSRRAASLAGALTRKQMWAAARPLFAIGNGPWLILPECPAPMHNSSTAVKGVEGVRCVCPRALAIKKAYAKAESDRKRRLRGTLEDSPERGARRSADLAVVVASYMSNILGGARPDLRGAACATDLGRKVMDAALDEPSQATTSEAERLFCRGCPAKEACGGWALSSEVNRHGQLSGGAWGGVYGGMSASERKKLTGGAR